MKVLHVIPTYYPAFNAGGPTWSVHNLNKWLVKKGIDVTVYTTNINGKDVLDVPVNEPVDVNGVRVYYFKKSPPRFWAYSRALHRMLKNTAGEFDLIHVTSTFLAASALGGYYARKNGIPYVISPRGNLMKEPLGKKSFRKRLYVKLIEGRNLRRAAAVHFTVPRERREYEEISFKCRRAVIVPNGIDPDKFEEAEQNAFRDKFNISKDKKIVLFLGRISWKKGLDTLIPAFRLVAEKGIDAVLVIAGGDDEGYKKRVERMIKRNGLEDKVVFTGPLAGKNKTAAYHEADVFVLPSYSENFGMAVVEAMYFSLPVVVSDRVGIAPEIIKANAGMVVAKKDSLVADGIIKILENPGLAGDLGKKGKSMVINKYLMSTIAEKWVGAYSEIIKKNE